MSDPRHTNESFAQKSSLAKLAFCRGLLNDLDPKKPPLDANSKEFRWQYRALQERVSVYSECLAELVGSPQSQPEDLRKATAALNLSLDYFEDVLAPKSDPGE